MWLLPFGYRFFMLKMSLLKNTYLGEKGKELREQEQKRLKNEERLKNEKIYSITTSPSFRLLHLAVTG